MHILDKIVNHKIVEVAKDKLDFPIDKMIDKIESDTHTRSMMTSISSKSFGGVIAEFKRKSPSKPDINLKADTQDIIPAYENAKAAGLSILTDTYFFGGSKNDLKNARSLTSLPILRKDFIIDPYQIYESKYLAADVILLIARILTVQQLKEYTELSHHLSLEVLVEVHDQEELDKCPVDADMIGINNRNLDTFEVDYDNSIKLIDQLPSEKIKISESGIHDESVMKRLFDHGFNGFLIGERFMKTSSPGMACANFIADYHKQFSNES